MDDFDDIDVTDVELEDAPGSIAWPIPSSTVESTVKHASDSGIERPKRGRPKNPLVSEKIQAIRSMFAEGHSYSVIARKFGCSHQYVQNVCRPSPEIVKALRERARDCCESCGIPIVKGGHVHHIHGASRSFTDVDNVNHLDNLRYFCASCHRREHKGTPRDVSEWLPLTVNAPTGLSLDTTLKVGRVDVEIQAGLQIDRTLQLKSRE